MAESSELQVMSPSASSSIIRESSHPYFTSDAIVVRETVSTRRMYGARGVPTSRTGLMIEGPPVPVFADMSSSNVDVPSTPPSSRVPSEMACREIAVAVRKVSPRIADTPEKAKLRSDVDSLRQQLQETQRAAVQELEMQRNQFVQAAVNFEAEARGVATAEKIKAEQETVSRVVDVAEQRINSALSVARDAENENAQLRDEINEVISDARSEVQGTMIRAQELVTTHESSIVDQANQFIEAERERMIAVVPQVIVSNDPEASHPEVHVLEQRSLHQSQVVEQSRHTIV